MPRFYFETDTQEPCPILFGGADDVLVYFVSLAYSTRYGSQHDLSKLALLLRAEHKISMEPLLTFADRNIEEDEDAEEFERVWQDAGPLAETLRRVTAVLESPDDRVGTLLADSPDLPARLDDLRRMADWAAERNSRVRLSFEL